MLLRKGDRKNVGACYDYSRVSGHWRKLKVSAILDRNEKKKWPTNNSAKFFSCRRCREVCNSQSFCLHIGTHQKKPDRSLLTPSHPSLRQETPSVSDRRWYDNLKNQCKDQLCKKLVLSDRQLNTPGVLFLHWCELFSLVYFSSAFPIL